MLELPLGVAVIMTHWSSSPVQPMMWAPTHRVLLKPSQAGHSTPFGEVLAGGTGGERRDWKGVPSWAERPRLGTCHRVSPSCAQGGSQVSGLRGLFFALPSWRAIAEVTAPVPPPHLEGQVGEMESGPIHGRGQADWWNRPPENYGN